MRRVQLIGLAAGAAGLVASAAGYFADPAAFHRAWLVAFLWCLGLTLGALGMSLLNHLGGGGWGLTVRRPWEAALATLPLLAVAFVPVVLGLHALYPWADAALVASDPVLQHKAAYLSRGGFAGRALAYFALWGVLALGIRRWSLAHDGGDDAARQRIVTIAGPGLAFYVLSMTFASVDWMMSLDPHWFSTVYALLVVVSQSLSALAFGVLCAAALRGREREFTAFATPDRVHDLGNLMLAFTLLWAYLMLSQYLIIWAGNLAEETPWYHARSHGGWRTLTVALMVFHFALPFLVLLTRPVKRDVRRLAYVAGLVLAMGLVNLEWLVTPSAGEHGASLHWLDLTCVAGLGGAWLAVFVWQLGRRPLVSRAASELVLEQPLPEHIGE